jgi:hypothetical protein
MIDLQAIFGDAPMGIGPDPEPQASDNAPALEEKAGNPTATVDAPKPAPAPSGEPNAGRVPFPDWVLRPDATGRLGWEPPWLSEERRWWARVRFDDLPTLAAYFPGSVHRPEDGPCCRCGRRDWWQSQAWPDVVRCGWCSPPAPGVAAEWLSRPGTDPAGKSVAQEAGCCVSAVGVDA